MLTPVWILVTGDLLSIALVTVMGFASHGEANLTLLPRMLAAFMPLTFAWFLLAPWLGLFRKEITSSLKQLWRPMLAMLFAGPFAVVLRGLILNTPIIPIFAVVFSTTSAVGMLAWRGIYHQWHKNKQDDS